mmetsp:Transcript_95374/g.218456  ORF Transcript_95374/g.218456 Transcript_95374/m.218456 type:complete len:210 (-) Transcript_95374:150-779(-)
MRLVEMRRADQLPFQVVGPMVIRAIQPFLVSTAGAQLGSAVPTYVMKRVQLAVPVHRDDERLRSDINNAKITMALEILHMLRCKPLLLPNHLSLHLLVGGIVVRCRHEGEGKIQVPPGGRVGGGVFPGRIGHCWRRHFSQLGFQFMIASSNLLDLGIQVVQGSPRDHSWTLCFRDLGCSGERSNSTGNYLADSQHVGWNTRRRFKLSSR